MANKTKTDAAYNRMLALITAHLIVSKPCLMTLSKSDRYGQRMIQQAEDNGHIKVRKLLYGKRKRKEFVCSITTKGFRYLQSLRVYSWMEDIPSDKRIGLFTEDVNDNRILRLSRMASASIMAYAAGATCHLPLFSSTSLSEELSDEQAGQENETAHSELHIPDYSELDDSFFLSTFELDENEDFGIEDIPDCYDYDHDYEEEVYAEEYEDHFDSQHDGEVNSEPKSNSQNVVYLSQALVKANDYCEANGEAMLGIPINKLPTFAEDEIWFTDSIRVKHKVAIDYLKKETIQDYRRCEFCGVLDTRKKSMLVYVPGVSGMGWSLWIRNLELGLFRLWKIAYALADQTTLYRDRHLGVVLVKNAMYFEDVFFDKTKRRNEEESLGHGFRRFYVCPMNYEGAKYLNWLMTTDDSEVEASIVTLALENGYTKAQDGRTDIFPLVSDDGTRYAVGMYLDLVAMTAMQAIMDRKPGKYGIICLEWQAEYYKRAFPDAAIVTW